MAHPDTKDRDRSIVVEGLTRDFADLRAVDARLQ